MIKVSPLNIKSALCFIAISVGSQLSTTMAYAQQLLMLEQAGCAYCEQWDAEIGDIYPKTWEGKLAPLRRVDIHNPWPTDLKNVKPDIFTPTFILVNNGVEIGRLRGYAGDEFFWVLLDELLEKLEL